MIDNTILSHLALDENYGRKVLPFLKEEYFYDHTDKVLFKVIKHYIDTYNKFPTKEALFIDVSNLRELNEELYKKCNEKINGLNADSETSHEWLLDQTEQFCQDKAIQNGLRQAIKILDDKGTTAKGDIPKILSDALAVSFDTNVGHDFLSDWEDRYEYYNRVEEKLEFDIDMLNDITNGGIPKKTLNVIIAPTGVGKTLIMCHMSAAYLLKQKNVLYITLEMAEERIAERIDANMLDIPVTEMKTIEKETFNRRISNIRDKTKGKLIIKEYPTACAGAHNFRYLLNELRLKKNFVPDVIFIDYINLCVSSRLKYGQNVNTNTYIKSIAEEVRGLAVEFNLPVWTATQTNRTGFSDSDFDMDSTAESFGLPQTVDFMLAAITSEELQELNQYMFKQLKNRYGDPNRYRKFVVGVDKPKMRLYNVESSAQDLIDDTPIMDKTNFGMNDKFNMEVFKNFK